MELFKNISIKKDKNHKEKLSDKYYRLKQNDSVTFNKLVQIILLPSTHQTVRITIFRAIKHMKLCLEGLNSFKILQSIQSFNTTLKFRSKR